MDFPEIPLRGYKELFRKIEMKNSKKLNELHTIAREFNNNID